MMRLIFPIICFFAFPADLAAMMQSEIAATKGISLHDSWAVLENPENASLDSLVTATLAIVRTNDADHLNKLVATMEKDSYHMKFLYPRPLNKALESYPFSTLVLRIAECKNLQAEKLLIKLAQSESISSKLKGKGVQHYLRSKMIIVAMGNIQPKNEGIYKILEQGVKGSLCMSSATALSSLAKIGNDQSVKLVRKNLFASKKHWGNRKVRFYLYNVGEGRHHPAIFSLLLDLAEEAPDKQLQLHALQALVWEKSYPFFTDGGSFPLPSYKTVAATTRKQMRERIAAVDKNKLGPKSKKLLDQLDELLQKENETGKGMEPLFSFRQGVSLPVLLDRRSQ